MTNIKPIWEEIRHDYSPQIREMACMLIEYSRESAKLGDKDPLSAKEQKTKTMLKLEYIPVFSDLLTRVQLGTGKSEDTILRLVQRVAEIIASTENTGGTNK